MKKNPKAECFYREIDKGVSRTLALKRAGYQPTTPASANSIAYALLQRRYGAKPTGYDRLTLELQAVWRGLSESDKTFLENLGKDDGTLESNLRTLAGLDPKPPTPPALPEPSPPPAPLPEPEQVHQFGFIEPAPAFRFEDEPGNCGLPYDFVLGLQETAYMDKPVEEGIWDAEHGFRSRDDLEREVEKVREAERQAALDRMDPWRAHYRKLGAFN